MKKIRWFLMSVAIMTAVGGAVAASTQAPCTIQQQYYRFAGQYFPAGGYGVEYYCFNGAGICTYWKPNPANPNGYVPCRLGAYVWIW